MPHNRKGPAGANRWAFYKIKLTDPIVPSLPGQLAMVYREAMTSKDPRVLRLGLQILWRRLGEFLQAEAE